VSDKLKMYKCINCGASKKAMHYTSKMRTGKEDCLCNNCKDRYFTKIECMACGIKKAGTNFNRLMIIGVEDPYCHFCKSTGKVIVNKRNKEVVIYKRKCLRCEKEFDTTNKYIRCCSGCKSPELTFSMETYGV
jgi:hypothetical protein